MRLFKSFAVVLMLLSIGACQKETVQVTEKAFEPVKAQPVKEETPEEKLAKQATGLCDYGRLLLNEGRFGNSTQAAYGNATSFDINNDGIDEEIITPYARIMNEMKIYRRGYNACAKEKDAEMGGCDNLHIRDFAYRWDLGDYGTMTYQGKNYITYAASGNLEHKEIIEFSKEMDYRVMCTYKRIPGQKVTFAIDENLCSDIVTGKVEEIKIQSRDDLQETEEKTEKYEKVKKYISRNLEDYRYVGVGYLNVDIDNDGTIEDVYRLQYETGRPAAFGFLAMTKDYEIFEEVPGFELKEDDAIGTDIIKVNGKYYVTQTLGYGKEPDTNVYRILKTNKEKVCTISSTPTFRVNNKNAPGGNIGAWRTDRKGSDDEGDNPFYPSPF